MGFTNHTPWELFKAEQDMLNAKDHASHLDAQKRRQELALATTLRKHY
jgi:hypothetical protein